MVVPLGCRSTIQEKGTKNDIYLKNWSTKWTNSYQWFNKILSLNSEHKDVLFSILWETTSEFKLWDFQGSPTVPTFLAWRVGWHTNMCRASSLPWGSSGPRPSGSVCSGHLFLLCASFQTAPVRWTGWREDGRIWTGQFFLVLVCI